MRKKQRQAKLLPIRIYGDVTLRKIAELVEEITQEVRDFIDDLVYTMYEKEGVGLAAPQVGKSWRIFVVDPFWFREGGKKNPYVFINPEFIEFEGKNAAEEGCLSLPNIYDKVLRPERVEIKGLNPYGKEISSKADGLFARSLQHENDHLDGILFTDKIPKLRKMLHIKKLNDLAKTTDENGVNIGNIKF